MEFLTVEISGMGGSYEDSCQKMLYAGIKHMKKNAPFEFAIEDNYIDYEDEKMKELEKAMLSVCDDCTGAMFHCVASHLHSINEYGKTAWRYKFPYERLKIVEI